LQELKAHVNKLVSGILKTVLSHLIAFQKKGKGKAVDMVTDEGEEESGEREGAGAREGAGEGEEE
jgi:hypothetical protein